MGRLSRWPAEWLYTLTVIGAALWVLWWLDPELIPLHLQIYRNLATAFVTVHYLVDIFAAVPFAALCWWLAGLGAQFTGAPNERLPAPAPPRGTRWRRAGIFLASLIVSLGLFWWWANAAPIRPALAWPLVVVATTLPLTAFPRASASYGSP